MWEDKLSKYRVRICRAVPVAGLHGKRFTPNELLSQIRRHHGGDATPSQAAAAGRTKDRRPGRMKASRWPRPWAKAAGGAETARQPKGERELAPSAAIWDVHRCTFGNVVIT